MSGVRRMPTWWRRGFRVLRSSVGSSRCTASKLQLARAAAREVERRRGRRRSRRRQDPARPARSRAGRHADGPRAQRYLHRPRRRRPAVRAHGRDAAHPGARRRRQTRSVAYAGPAAAELGRLVSELDDPRIRPVTASSPPAARPACSRWCSACSNGSPSTVRCSLLVEDLHWADRSTRDLLAYLIHQLGPAPSRS